MSARPHHYAFAHVALPQTFFDDPASLVGALMSRGRDLLLRIWDDVGGKVERIGDGATRLPPDGLDLAVREIGPRTLALIVSLPRPEQVPEAHLVALVLGLAPAGPGEAVEQKVATARYLTLEHGLRTPSRRPCTVLCEWRGETHCNLGEGPPATVEAFAERLSQLISPGGD